MILLLDLIHSNFLYQKGAFSLLIIEKDDSLTELWHILELFTCVYEEHCPGEYRGVQIRIKKGEVWFLID